MGVHKIDIVHTSKILISGMSDFCLATNNQPMKNIISLPNVHINTSHSMNSYLDDVTSEMESTTSSSTTAESSIMNTDGTTK